MSTGSVSSSGTTPISVTRPRLGAGHVLDHQSAARSRTAADRPPHQPAGKALGPAEPAAGAQVEPALAGLRGRRIRSPLAVRRRPERQLERTGARERHDHRRRRCRRLPARSHPARELRAAHVRVREPRRGRHGHDRRPGIHAQSGRHRQGTGRQDQRRQQRHRLRRRRGQRRNDRPLQPHDRRHRRRIHQSQRPGRRAERKGRHGQGREERGIQARRRRRLLGVEHRHRSDRGGQPHVLGAHQRRAGHDRRAAPGAEPEGDRSEARIFRQRLQQDGRRSREAAHDQDARTPRERERTQRRLAVRRHRTDERPHPHAPGDVRSDQRAARRNGEPARPRHQHGRRERRDLVAVVAVGAPEAEHHDAREGDRRTPERSRHDDAAVVAELRQGRPATRPGPAARWKPGSTARKARSAK